MKFPSRPLSSTSSEAICIGKSMLHRVLSAKKAPRVVTSPGNISLSPRFINLSSPPGSIAACDLANHLGGARCNTTPICNAHISSSCFLRGRQSTALAFGHEGRCSVVLPRLESFQHLRTRRFLPLEAGVNNGCALHAPWKRLRKAKRSLA